MFWLISILAILVLLLATARSAHLAYQMRDRRFIWLSLIFTVLTIVECVQMIFVDSEISSNLWLFAIGGFLIGSMGIFLIIGLRRFTHEQEYSRAKFFGIINQAEDGIISTTREQIIVLFNRGAERIFGYSAEEVIGKSLEMLIPARSVEVHRKQFHEFEESGVISRRMSDRRRVSGVRKDGSEVSVEVSISRLDLPGERLFTAIVRDATERVRYESEILALNEELENRVAIRTEELRHSNEQLRLQHQENEMFVYSVSHDLRSPLVNLEGFSKELGFSRKQLQSLLKQSSLPNGMQEKVTHILDQEMLESIQFIENSVSRLTQIIDALLRLSRAGRVEYLPKNLSMESMIQRILGSLNATIEEKHAKVIVHDLPNAWGDPVAIEQIFSNLIGNAINYLDINRTGRIEIGSLESEDGKWSTYYVRDNGIGIAENHQKQVFLAFRRLNSEMAPGEGIGLVIVRRVVERHGGQIWFESKVGEGSTFFVKLPNTKNPGKLQANE